MQEIKVLWIKYSARLNALTLRERGIIFGTVAVVMFLAFWVVIVEAYFENKKILVSQINSAKSQLADTDTALTILRAAAAHDPNIKLRQENDSLVALSDGFDNKISAITNALISPRQMTALLEQILRDQKKLKLIKLLNTPVEEIQLGAQDSGISIYRHSFRMQINGKYLDVVDYLNGVEGLPWKVYWQYMDFEISRYPKGVLNIELYTLSTNKELIGV